MEIIAYVWYCEETVNKFFSITEIEGGGDVVIVYVSVVFILFFFHANLGATKTIERKRALYQIKALSEVYYQKNFSVSRRTGYKLLV